MNKEFLQNLAINHEQSLRLIAKDIEHLARMTKKTPFEEEEKFQSNLVQGAFYLTAISMASKAFNAMIEEKQVNPECDRGQVDYFMDQILAMQKANMDAEMKMKEGKDDN